MMTIEEKEQSIMLSLQNSQELIGNINLAELPVIIDAQVAQISRLGTKIETALTAADKAKEAAKKAEDMSAGLGHKKKAIEELQKSGKQSAEAIGETVDALKLSFEYEKQLGEISKFLIALGAFSAEHTRQTVARLKAEILNKGTGTKLNDVAKKQLVQVIAQLEAQGETIRRQEELAQEIAEQQALLEEKDEQDDRQDIQIARNAESISAHSQVLSVHQQHNDRQDKDIQELQEQDEQQDALIAENAQDIDALEQQDAEQDKLIAESIEKNKVQDAQISENAQDIDALERQDAEQDILIAEGIEKDKEHDAQISENAQAINVLEKHNAQQDILIAQIATKNEDHDARLVRTETDNARQDELLRKQSATIEELRLQIQALKNEKGSKVFMYVSAALTGATLILSILHFFI